MLQEIVGGKTHSKNRSGAKRTTAQVFSQLYSCKHVSGVVGNYRILAVASQGGIQSKVDISVDDVAQDQTARPNPNPEPTISSRKIVEYQAVTACENPVTATTFDIQVFNPRSGNQVDSIISHAEYFSVSDGDSVHSGIDSDAGSFDKDCELITLRDTTEAFTHGLVVPFIDANSAQSWRLEFEEFADPEVTVVIEATEPTARSQLQLSQLTGIMADGSLRRQRAEVDEVGAGERSSTAWRYAFPTDEVTMFLLSNVADGAGDTKVMRNLQVRFTAVKEYARMGAGPGGGGGPSAGDIDSALPIELDRFHGYVYPFSYRKVGEQYIGSGDFTEGVVKPCVVRFLILNNSNTGDVVSFAANLSGPLTPREYQFSDGKKHPEEAVGAFIGSFVIGAGNSLSGGRRGEYVIKSGSVTIQSVAGGVVRGSLTGNGSVEHKSIKDIKLDPAPFPNLSISADFSIQVDQMERPFKPHPYRCLQAQPPAPGGGGGGRPRTRNGGSSNGGSSGSGSPGNGDGPGAGSPPTSLSNGSDGSGGEGGAPPAIGDAPNQPGGSEGSAQSQSTSPATPGSGDGSVDGYSKWIKITSSGSENAELIIADNDLRLTGGCTGKTPIRLGFSKGTTPGKDWINFAIESGDTIGTGQTGTFNLKEVNWDYGSVQPRYL